MVWNNTKEILDAVDKLGIALNKEVTFLFPFLGFMIIFCRCDIPCLLPVTSFALLSYTSWMFMWHNVLFLSLHTSILSSRSAAEDIRRFMCASTLLQRRWHMRKRSVYTLPSQCPATPYATPSHICLCLRPLRWFVKGRFLQEDTDRASLTSHTTSSENVTR